MRVSFPQPAPSLAGLTVNGDANYKRKCHDSSLQCEALVRPYYRGRTDALSGGWTQAETQGAQLRYVPPANWQDWRCLRRATRRISISGTNYLVCWQHKRVREAISMIPK